MSGDPLQPAIHEETLIGYALNRLLRGDTPQEAYQSLRRDDQFSHYSTQAISGAVRTARRLQGIAADYQGNPDETRLSSQFGNVFRGSDQVGYRVVITYTDRDGTPRAASAVVNARADVARSELLRMAEAFILSRLPDSPRARGFIGGNNPPRVTSVLPGGYQGGADFTDL